MQKKIILAAILFSFSKIYAQNVGINVSSPDVNLSVLKDIRIDAENANNGTINNSLRFGPEPTGEYIFSKRTTGGNQYGIDLFAGHSSRLSIANTGDVLIGSTQSGNLLINGTTVIDNNFQNKGTLNFGLRFGSSVSGEGIASNRNTGANQYGLDFYTGGSVKMSIGLDGVVNVGNKPVLVSDILNAGRQKIMEVDAYFSGTSISPGFQGTATFGPFTFTNINAAWIAGFSTTSGECNKMLITTEIVNTATNTFNIKLHASNITSTPVTYNGKWKLLIMGGY